MYKFFFLLIQKNHLFCFKFVMGKTKIDFFKIKKSLLFLEDSRFINKYFKNLENNELKYQVTLLFIFFTT